MVEREEEHETGEARNFYAALPVPAGMGIERSNCTRGLPASERSWGSRK
jgi:hypothetical protein